MEFGEQGVFRGLDRSIWHRLIKDVSGLAWWELDGAWFLLLLLANIFVRVFGTLWCDMIGLHLKVLAFFSICKRNRQICTVCSYPLWSCITVKEAGNLSLRHDEVVCKEWKAQASMRVESPAKERHSDAMMERAADRAALPKHEMGDLVAQSFHTGDTLTSAIKRGNEDYGGVDR